jgi:chromosome segregation ATPase
MTDINKVRQAMEDLEARGINASVRRVRDEIGGGSPGDVAEAIRNVKEERAARNSVRTELPEVLQSKLSVLALDFWKASQEAANRAIDDARQGCAVRIAAAEAQASEAFCELDDAERRIADMSTKLDEENRRRADCEKSAQAASDRAAAAEARVAPVEAEIRVMRDTANRRERELEKAYAGLQSMTAVWAGTQKAKSAARAAGNGKTAGNAKPAAPAA